MGKDKTTDKAETAERRELSDKELEEAKISGGTGGQDKFDNWHKLPDGSGSGHGE